MTSVQGDIVALVFTVLAFMSAEVLEATVAKRVQVLSLIAFVLSVVLLTIHVSEMFTWSAS